MLGQPLRPDRRIFIMPYTPSAAPEGSARKAARMHLQRTFEKVDQYAAVHGVTREKTVEEAMEHIRPSKG
jgi:hypothetical protein